MFSMFSIYFHRLPFPFHSLFFSSFPTVNSKFLFIWEIPWGLEYPQKLEIANNSYLIQSIILPVQVVRYSTFSCALFNLLSQVPSNESSTTLSRRVFPNLKDFIVSKSDICPQRLKWPHILPPSRLNVSPICLLQLSFNN